jgi:diguanylate cyclase (GGDEF)-like protein/hemerythrin-like metal-binding protein
MAGIEGAGARFRDTCSLRRADGTEVPVAVDVARIVCDDGPRTLLVATDASVWTLNHARLSRLAFRDALTGLPNRALLCDRIEQAIAVAQRDADTVALMLLDLDRFKPINDALGHAAGDLAICEAARRLVAATRPEDTVARLGRDEFVVLLGGRGSQDDAALVAARHWRLGVSIGVAVYPADGRDQDQLLAQADGAMYAAKAIGGNGYVFAKTQHRGARAMVRLTWSADHMIGIVTIDVEHAPLVAEMNDLWTALCTGHGHGTLECRMAQMADLLQRRFATEGAHMLAHPYAGAAEHRAEHERVLEIVRGLTAHADDESVALSIRSLYDWLLRHVRTYDAELSRDTRDVRRQDGGPG